MPGHPLSLADAAYCAVAWASGETQKSLAASYGFKGPAPISLAIRAFLNVYAGDAVPAATRYRPRGRTGNVMFDRCIYAEERKALVPVAVRNFQRSRG